MILLLALTFTLYMGYYAIQLETDASFDTMYPADSQAIQLKSLVSSEFGATDTLFVLATIDDSVNDKNRLQDIREPAVIAGLDALARSMLEEQSVSQVFSVAELLKQQYGRLPQTLEESKEMIQGLIQDTSFFVSKDFSAANLIVSVDIPKKLGSIEKTERIIREKIENAQTPLGVKLVLTGEPTLLNRIMNLLINDNLITIGIALIFVTTILWIFFRSPKIAIVAIQPVILTLIWLAGTLVLLGIRINMMTAAVGAMMVGMGIDYSIHMSHGFHENVKRNRPTSKTVPSIGRALFASAMTTIAGFVALLFGVSPSSQIQGTVLAIGIAYAFLSTLLVLPCLLHIQRRIMYTPFDEVVFKIGKKRKAQNVLIQKALFRLGKIQSTHPWKIIGFVMVFTILVVPGMTLVYTDTDNSNWIPEGDDVIEALNRVVADFGGTERLNLLIMSESSETIQDMRHPQVLRAVHLLDQSLEELEYINMVSSPTDNILLYRNALPNSLENVKNVLQEYPFIAQDFNKDFSIMRITLTSDLFGDPETDEDAKHFQEILNEVETISFPKGIAVVPQGSLPQFLELRNNISSDMGKTTLIGFFFVIIIASLFYRSFVVGMLSFIPIIFSIVWAISIMGYIGLPFTILTSGMLAIVMGMGIDFSIHLVHNTKEWLKEGHGIEESIIHSITTTGEAIFVATITTITGFLSLAGASLLVTQRLGYTLALAIGTSFLACMLIVPAVLMIEYRIKHGGKTT